MVTLIPYATITLSVTTAVPEARGVPAALAALGAGPACAFGAAFGSAFGAGAFPRGTVSGGKSIGSGSGRLGTAVATSKCHSRSCHAIQSV